MSMAGDKNFVKLQICREKPVLKSEDPDYKFILQHHKHLIWVQIACL